MICNQRVYAGRVIIRLMIRQRAALSSKYVCIFMLLVATLYVLGVSHCTFPLLNENLAPVREYAALFPEIDVSQSINFW